MKTLPGGGYPPMRLLTTAQEPLWSSKDTKSYVNSFVSPDPGPESVVQSSKVRLKNCK